MQYVSSVNSIPYETLSNILRDATKRSASARGVYQIWAESDTYRGLADIAMGNGAFNDMIDGANKDSSWCLRVRHMDREKFGKKQRSSKKSTIEATNEMTEVLQKVSR